MRIVGWVVLALVLCLPRVSAATFDCFGPYTLTVAARTTPIPTVSPVSTPTVYPSPSDGDVVVNIYRNHVVFASFTDDGDVDGSGALYAQPYIKILGLGPGTQTVPVLNIGTAADTPTGLTPTAVADGGAYTAYKITDTPLKGFRAQLIGCINCAATLSWCSSD